jgi:5-methylcytosine-specific restriction endonuclease McrA
MGRNPLIRRNKYWRRKVMDRFKVRKGCASCGYNSHPYALEFDHIDPATKRMKISDMYCYSWKRVKVELAKCQVLCGNCHNIKTISHMRKEDV